MYSCVIDVDHQFAYQSLVWVRTLLDLAHVPAAQLVVHAVRGCDPAHLDLLRSMGIRVEMVRPVDARHGPCNKLAQLASPALQDAEFVVLCDCDLAFAGDISAYIDGDAIRAKVVDIGKPNLEDWRSILHQAALPASRLAPARPSHSADETVANNFNGGLYVIPQPLFQILGAAWPEWNSWVLDHAAELPASAEAYADQVAFALAIASQGLKTDPLPTGANFPIHLPYEARDRDNLEPLVLHYHGRLDRSGQLRTTGMRGVDQAIARVNVVIAETPPSMMAGALQGLGRWHDRRRDRQRRTRRDGVLARIGARRRG
jgi:hypothetical protein